MASRVDIENCIESKYREYQHLMNNQQSNISYEEFEKLYKSIHHEKLKDLFILYHAELTGLFNLMNTRLPTKEQREAHFWADQSRELLFVIEGIFVLKRELKNTSYAFVIDDYYESLLKSCSQWLSKNGGSMIPPNTPKVTLYYMKPIFISVNENLPYQELHILGEQSELIGHGGFGEVYRYKHPIVDIDFAVKVFNPLFVSEEDKVEGEKRFFREVKMLFLLNNPNIVRIYDVGRLNGNPFIKMEYVKGMTFEELRNKKGNFSFLDAAKAILQVLNGLQDAHNNGIIHRDLKPSNIMVDVSGDKYMQDY